MDDLRINRGRRPVTFRKIDSQFAVKLKQGRASNRTLLEASCGRPVSAITHLDSALPEGMEIFGVDETDILEETMAALRRAPAAAIVTHMYAIDDTPGCAVIPTGTITMQFKRDVPLRFGERILEEHGLDVVEDLEFLPHGYTARLTTASVENPLKICRKLQQLREVAHADPNIAFQVSLKHRPTDSHYPEQWHLNNQGDRLGLVAGADVKAEGAWEYTTGTRDIVVCVIDDGFDLEHPDFNAPNKVIAPRDFGQNDFDPSPVWDEDNHGTACAGVAIAEENGHGVVGLAPGCAFMPIRMSNWLSDGFITTLFRHAMDYGADVISCSWSAAIWDFPLSTVVDSIIHEAATQGRGGKGCVILWAAGNEDRPLDGTKDGVPSHQGFALHPDCIAVAASNSMDMRANYSNFGPQIAICAPSSGGPGRGVWTTDRRATKGYSADDYTGDFGGTSSATPLAAGLAALILTKNPELTSAEVKRVMMESADKIDPQGGHYTDGTSPYYGSGRINAHMALALVAGDGPERLANVLALEHRVSTPIHDFETSIDSVTFSMPVTVTDIEISLDITHTYRGDLKVVVRTPWGEEVLLHDRTGGGHANLVRKYRSTDDPEMFRHVVGRSAEGEWKLIVDDQARRDVGVINKWGLAVTYTRPSSPNIAGPEFPAFS